MLQSSGGRRSWKRHGCRKDHRRDRVAGAYLRAAGYKTAPAHRPPGCEPEARRNVRCEPVVPAVEAIWGLHPQPNGFFIPIFGPQPPQLSVAAPEESCLASFLVGGALG